MFTLGIKRIKNFHSMTEPNLFIPLNHFEKTLNFFKYVLLLRGQTFTRQVKLSRTCVGWSNYVTNKILGFAIVKSNNTIPITKFLMHHKSIKIQLRCSTKHIMLLRNMMQVTISTCWLNQGYFLLQSCWEGRISPKLWHYFAL